MLDKEFEDSSTGVSERADSRLYLEDVRSFGTNTGPGNSVAYLIPWSMLPDVVDVDELNTGLRREGIYYGFFVFLHPEPPC